MKYKFFFRGICFEADKGAGGGDINTPPNPDPSATTPPAGAQKPDTSGADKSVPIERFNEINNELKRLKDEATKKAKEQQAEDEKKLAAQQEWQKLAESRKEKLDELEPANTALTERVGKLEQMLASNLEAEVKEWPDEVKALDPGKDADVLTRLEWANKSRALAAKLGGQPPTAGNGRRPPPVAPAGVAVGADKQQQQWSRKAARRYR